MYQLPENILVGIRTWFNSKEDNYAEVVALTQTEYDKLCSTGQVNEMTLYVIV